MRIEIKIYNSNTDEEVLAATAPDINSAIAELGSMERALESYGCKKCKEPTSSTFCCDDCALEAEIEREKDILVNDLV